jgi:hypothetical protein
MHRLIWLKIHLIGQPLVLDFNGMLVCKMVVLLLLNIESTSQFQDKHLVFLIQQLARVMLQLVSYLEQLMNLRLKQRMSTDILIIRAL